MSYKTLLFEVNENIAKIVLNRPEAMNALSTDLAMELIEVFQDLATKDNIRAVILTGTGKAFSAGGDVKQMATVLGDDAPAKFRLALDIYHKLILLMRQLSKPIIAAINGVAAGAGFNLALACDVRIAAESAKFSQAFIRIGLIPDFGGTFFLPRIVGSAKAMELMMTGELIDAEKANQLGIVNLVVKNNELDETANFFAQQASSLPTAAIGRLKKLLDSSSTSSLTEQLELEAQMQMEASATEDFREGVKAFVEKRQPKFTGK
ncbi:MAG: enoyl-CoA hydratase/isomerase family protein [Acidobacteria bacterium]|nr:enoyl-CoA hydratase/isomerase family protein [Acidobacteriota bacterium]